MAFTATINSVSRSEDPGSFDISVTYLDSADPEWRVPKTLRVIVDPAATVQVQRQTVQSAIQADAQRYKQQLAVYGGLLSLVDQTFTI